MEKFATENLILLEFLVDQLSLDYEIQKELKNMAGDTCVSFQFLDNAPLLICEQDFSNKTPCSIRDQSSIKNGKSCLFSLTPQQADEASKQFDIYVEVFRKMKAGILPDKLPVGESLVSIVNLFNELVESISTNGESPAAKTLKDCFKITNDKGEDVGHISVYIRMSCFGKLIVTQFQMNLEDKSVQFRAKEGHYLFKYNKSKGSEKGGCVDWQKNNQAGMQNQSCPQISCDDAMKQQNEQSCPLQPCNYPSMQQQSQPPCLMSQFASAIPQSPFQMTQGQPPCAMPQQSPCGICLPPQPPCPLPQFSCPMPPCGICGMPQPPCGMPQQQGMQIEVPCNECNAPADPNSAYQEIGAAMGGNALTIRVHKDRGKIEQVTESEISDSDACSCSLDKASYQPHRNFSPPCIQGPCCGPPCGILPCCVGPPPCCGIQQSLAMRPGAQDAESPFSFKMGGCGAGANNNVTVNPPHCVTKDGTCFTEISDPNKDVFVLRIGKKSEGVDKKNNLELELCTPKGPEIKPAPKKETRETQYDELDIPLDASASKTSKGKAKGKGKGKGKGKKGKGKKGKKGKKK